MKTKQKKKLGRVVRISPFLDDLVTKKRLPRESIAATLERLLGRSSDAKIYFILPEARIVCETIEEARGKAILIAVKSGMKKPKEKPIAVRVV